jgi:hypothetical protein
MGMVLVFSFVLAAPFFLQFAVALSRDTQAPHHVLALLADVLAGGGVVPHGSVEAELRPLGIRDGAGLVVLELREMEGSGEGLRDPVNADGDELDLLLGSVEDRGNTAAGVAQMSSDLLVAVEEGGTGGLIHGASSGRMD